MAIAVLLVGASNMATMTTMHTPANRLTETLGRVHLGHPSCGQLTPAKTMYPLASIL